MTYISLHFHKNEFFSQIKLNSGLHQTCLTLSGIYLSHFCTFVDGCTFVDFVTFLGSRCADKSTNSLPNQANQIMATLHWPIVALLATTNTHKYFLHIWKELYSKGT